MEFKMKKLLLITLCLVGANAWAECELQYKQASDIAVCYEKESFSKVIANYNKLLKITKTDTYSKYGLKPLVQSQSDWLKFRDSYCESYSIYHGEINNHANCIIDMNNKRAEQLQNDIDAS